jgi:hypothetical protein
MLDGIRCNKHEEVQLPIERHKFSWSFGMVAPFLARLSCRENDAMCNIRRVTRAEKAVM